MLTMSIIVSVKQGIYALLGTLAQYYPELFVNYSERLLGIYMSEMKRQVTVSEFASEFGPRYFPHRLFRCR